MNRLVGIGAVALSALLISAAPAAAAPVTSLSASSGAPEASLTVSGTGFDASKAIAVYVDTENVALATSSATGVVSASIQIPAGAQPGKHWITLEELGTYAAAQAPFTVVMNWPQGGWGASWRSFNPLENTINTGNASQLTEAWGQALTAYSNPKPFVVYNNYVYVFDESEKLHAYTSTGKLIWTAAPGTTIRSSQAAPTEYGGYIYIGDAAGLVTAYPALCRTDGGVCTTQKWSAHLGTAVNGGLTEANGWIYAPGADGVVHVLNASTGVAGTSITPFGTSGAITQPVSFGADGTAYIVLANQIAAVGPGSKVTLTYAGGTYLSAAAVGNGNAYVTSTDGNLDQEPGGWATAIGGTCDIAPAYANGVVYAAGCTSVGAYDAGTGAVLWSTPIASAPQGLSVANGVLYACYGYVVHMYDAGYGGLLGSAGHCNGAPEVAGGVLYTTYTELTASTLTGALITSARGVHARPNPRRLRPSPRLLRRYARHHRRAMAWARGAGRQRRVRLTLRLPA